ncbi:CAP domain-containing protein [Conexibacter sp. JD483]|uniref:CAP domain-containing protein n=1 Tax=unclassified Conexibacter TaxID=2627773 RepID=UPI002715ECAA|nr:MULTISPECIES: CAP domain-containing protein [unclassified Conexibacter]MDO8185499.1 CAP domain-containing protein [Conexibacter sp. CPCC 205706]MDO8197314.1 CAP domain-containing protein [Conexibacter sp. CPCC 205762]MDR9370186.1 CAP domain-containing protein [Conexibacter sp. JD483]
MQRPSGFRAWLTAASLAIVALLAASTSALAARCADVHTTPAEDAGAAHRATLCLLNQQRAAHGLRPLRSNDALASAARGHSRDMVRRSFFDHTAPGNVTFVDRIRRARYSPRGSWSVGENLAWGSGNLSEPASIVAGWMRSPGHRSNILNGRFRSIGLGIARGVPVDASAAMARSGATFTTDFGSS